MSAVSFRCYVTPDGVDEIRDWYNKQPAKVQGKFLSRLRTLSQQQMNDWKLPLFRWLHKECHPLGEIRFLALNVQYRPLGFRAGDSIFTMTFCAQEKSDRFVPSNACQRALGRMAEIKQNFGRSHALWLRLE